LENVKIAFKAKNSLIWGKEISNDLFLNNILPYISVNERRDNWRRDFYEKFYLVVKDCKTTGEAAVKLNNVMWDLIGVHYSPRPSKADQSPYESIELGIASCTGLSVLLIDACRSVAIPARFVGIPRWLDIEGNHSWVEIWDNGWHFLGAGEPGPLDKSWFEERASKADPDAKLYSIYAVSFKKTDLLFPAAWNWDINYIYAENITERYLKGDRKKKVVNLAVRVFDKPDGKRVEADVQLYHNGKLIAEGKTLDARHDMNDILNFSVKSGEEYKINIKYGDTKLGKKINTLKGETIVIDIVLTK